MSRDTWKPKTVDDLELEQTLNQVVFLFKYEGPALAKFKIEDILAYKKKIAQ